MAGVLSGNRNFEGRIHAQARANYLASPMLVVVYGLAGRVDIDLEREPVGMFALHFGFLTKGFSTLAFSLAKCAKRFLSIL